MIARPIGLFLAIVIALTSVLARGDNGKEHQYRDFIFGDYVFRVFQEIAENRGSHMVLSETLAVIRNGEKLYASDKEFRIFVNPSSILKHSQPGSLNPNLKQGVDITGDGNLNVVVETYSGGAHCCYGYLIFDVGENFRLVDELYTGDYPMGLYELDGKSGLEIILNDGNFAYWKAPFANSPAPRVILNYQEGEGYMMDAGLMRAPPMSDTEMKNKARTVRLSDRWDKYEMYPLESDLWDVMLKLIYSGNADQARDFLNMAWPGGRDGKEDFAGEFFDCILRHSSYWLEIAAMNGLKPLKPVGYCLPEGG